MIKLTMKILYLLAKASSINEPYSKLLYCTYIQIEICQNLCTYITYIHTINESHPLLCILKDESLNDFFLSSSLQLANYY